MYIAPSQDMPVPHSISVHHSQPLIIEIPSDMHSDNTSFSSESDESEVSESIPENGTINHAECACRQYYLAIIGDPEDILICHCRSCQRRTGSAFSKIFILII